MAIDSVKQNKDEETIHDTFHNKGIFILLDKCNQYLTPSLLLGRWISHQNIISHPEGYWNTYLLSFTQNDRIYRDYAI